MRLSSRAEYGSRALLVLAKEYGQDTIQSSEIALEADVPEAYLNQLLISLRRAGLVKSVRGPQGGHALARHPSQITLAEAIEALEGPLSPMECADPQAVDVCSLSGTCVLRPVWIRLREAIYSILNGISLEDLVEEDARRRQEITYHI